MFPEMLFLGVCLPFAHLSHGCALNPFHSQGPLLRWPALAEFPQWAVGSGQAGSPRATQGLDLPSRGWKGGPGMA